MTRVQRDTLVHNAVKRLVGTPAMNHVLDFYARTNIHSDLERFVLDQVARYNRSNGITK